MPHDPAFATRLGPTPRSWQTLRLKDRIKPGVRVLFVGINPGVRSALTGHHFAGYSNRFWKLLFESGLVPEPITFEEDDRLPEFGFGITNLISRPSPGIDDLEPAEYVEGWKMLDRKIRRYRPKVVALVGVTLYRAIEPLLARRGRSEDACGDEVSTDRARTAARRGSRCAGVRAAESQRPQREFHLRGDARRIHGARQIAQRCAVIETQIHNRFPHDTAAKVPHRPRNRGKLMSRT